MTECRFHNLMSISAVECRAPWTFASPKRPLLPSPQKEQNSQIQAVSSYFLTPQPPAQQKRNGEILALYTKSLLHSGGFQGCTRIAMPIPRCSLQPRVKLLANGAQVSSSEQEVEDSEDLFIFFTFSLQRSFFPRPNTYHMSQLAPISRNYLLCPVAFGTKMPWTGAASVLLTVERFQLNWLIWYGLITASLQRWKSKPCKSINELPHNRITGQLAPPTADAFLSCKCIALAPNTQSATHHQHI